MEKMLTKQRSYIKKILISQKDNREKKRISTSHMENLEIDAVRLAVQPKDVEKGFRIKLWKLK